MELASSTSLLAHPAGCLRRVTETDVARTWLHWRAGGADVAASGLGHVGRGGDGATGEGVLLRSA